MVERDASKEFLTGLADLQFDVLLVDFIDDRFKLIVVDEDRGLTDSNEFRRANVNLQKLDHRKFSCEGHNYRRYWQQGWKDLLRRLDDLRRRDSILINKVFWASDDDEGNPLPNRTEIAAANKYLSWAYEQAARDLCERHFIVYEPAALTACTGHKWGRSPFHYIPRFDAACLEAVRQFHRTRTD